MEENQDFDEVLEQLWMARRAHASTTNPEHFTDAQHRRLVDHDGAYRPGRSARRRQVDFTPKGEERARSVIRRHRLAERLFMDVLAIRDEGSIETNACTFEHILSPEVTDRICAFLGHPRDLPARQPDPAGRMLREGGALRGIHAGMLADAK